MQFLDIEGRFADGRPFTRERFLADMDLVVSWKSLRPPIEPPLHRRLVKKARRCWSCSLGRICE
jgi:hypothetical protein